MNKNYKEAINLLTSQGKFYINLGLERISAVLDLMGNPQDKLKCIHVAGTNGKGSVCSMLSTILTEAGFKTGLFTSPHIFNYTERIKIDNKEIDEDTFAEKVFKVQKIAELNDIHLTEFEILTAVMFEYFAQNEVDYAVVEVGLGGTYDSTNVIKNPVCSIITTIDFDHTDRLGNTIEQIAREKGGIIKPNCPVVINATNKGFNTIAGLCEEDQMLIANRHELGEMSLKGFHQQENLNLAISAMLLIKPNMDLLTIQKALLKVEHFGRFQYFEDKKILIDGAHNPNGISVLRENLNIFYGDEKLRFIFGCLKTKNYPEMIERLFTENDEIYFYHFNYKNSATFEELQSACKFSAKEYKGELPEFDGVTVICGSLYMIADLCNELSIIEK